MITPQLVAEFFDVANVYVGEGIYDTSVEGVAPVMADIWGKNVSVMYQDPNVGPFRKKATCPMRTFVWTGSPSGGRFGVSTYYEPQRKSNIAQVTDYTDEKVVDINTTYLLTTVIS
jgi:hypothetical protein